MAWQANPAADRKAVEAICDTLHVWLNSASPDDTRLRMQVAEECIEDIIAILHTSPNQEFGSVGEAAVTLSNARK